MRKLLPVVAACAMLLVGLPAFAGHGFDLGVSWAPADRFPAAPQPGEDLICGLHAGVGFDVLYASWDALALPMVMVADLAPYSVPGFLNLWDVGIRVPVGPLFGLLEVGVNRLYVYDVGLLGQPQGANLLAGAGLRFHWFGISITATTFFASFNELGATIHGLLSPSTRPVAWQHVVDTTLPSVVLILYF